MHAHATCRDISLKNAKHLIMRVLEEESVKKEEHHVKIMSPDGSPINYRD